MKVLFIGNSHTFVHHVPARVQRYCAEQGTIIEPVLLCKGGMGLDWHAKEPQTAFNLTFGNYDAVVLQHLAHPFPGRDHLLESMDAVAKFIPPHTKRFVYMPWSEKVNPQGQELLTEANETAAANIGATVCPVGRFWWPIKEAHPCEELYYPDGEHTSVLGASLSAVIIGRTLLGLPTEERDTDLIYEAAQKLAAWPDPPFIAWTATGVEYKA